MAGDGDEPCDAFGFSLTSRVHFQRTADANFAAGANALRCADALLYPLDPPDPDPCRGQHWGPDPRRDADSRLPA